MSGGDAATLAGALADRLRLFRVPVAALEVSVGGCVVGRVLDLGPNRPVVLDGRCGSVSVRRSDEDALRSLHEGRPHAIAPDVVDALAIGAMVRSDGAEGAPMLVAHALAPDGGEEGCHVTLCMADSVCLHGSEAEAVMAHVPEALWRAGWIGGEYPTLDHASASRIGRLVPDMLASA